MKDPLRHLLVLLSFVKSIENYVTLVESDAPFWFGKSADPVRPGQPVAVGP